MRSDAQWHFASRYRTLALDVRDAGRSDRATSRYTTADMADDVAGWLEALRIPSAHIAGQSLGGLVAASWRFVIPEWSRASCWHRRILAWTNGVRG